LDKISIIIPVYYNESSLQNTYDEVRKIIEENSGKFDYELILVDDGSGDNSYKVMRNLASADNKIKLVKLSKNFGSYVAILAGLNYSTGDVATYLAADLQDPPELISQMYDKWVEGNKSVMVFGVRSSREDPLVSRIYSYIFYKLFRTFVLPEYPKHGFDCFFINRKQIDLIVNMDEKNSHLTAQMVWLGYKQEYIYYHRQKREYGKSRWTFFKKFKLAFDTFFGFSGRPLRIASLLGMFVSFVGFLLAIYVLIKKFVSDTPFFGIPSILVAMLAIGGLILMTIGVLGEYMWRNFDASRKRPTFIVEETKNC
jgi:polyisoprenyl-phosphate glycosyltransferase